MKLFPFHISQTQTENGLNRNWPQFLESNQIVTLSQKENNKKSLSLSHCYGHKKRGREEKVVKAESVCQSQVIKTISRHLKLRLANQANNNEGNRHGRRSLSSPSSSSKASNIFPKSNVRQYLIKFMNTNNSKW